MGRIHSIGCLGSTFHFVLVGKSGVQLMTHAHGACNLCQSSVICIYDKNIIINYMYLLNSAQSVQHKMDKDGCSLPISGHGDIGYSKHMQDLPWSMLSAILY